VVVVATTVALSALVPSGITMEPMKSSLSTVAAAFSLSFTAMSMKTLLSWSLLRVAEGPWRLT